VLDLPWLGRRARHVADRVPAMRRRRPSGGEPRALLDGADMSAMPGEWPHRRDAVPGLQRDGSRASDPNPSGQAAPGVKDGARIKLTGKGEPGGAGVLSGDLYVRVKVLPHEIFGRKGDDLTVQLPITYSEAALGAQVQVPTLDGPVTLKVPAGTPGGKTFRVRGKGAPRKNGNGDLLATVQVDVPRKLSKSQKELLQQLRESETTSPRAELGVA